jgi:hypothetical protein
MPISFKSKLSSVVANQTFLDKTIDDLKKGKLGLYKVLPSDPDAIQDVQKFINQIADASGVIGEDDAARKDYSSNFIVANGDSRKQAIEKLDAAVQVNIDNIQDNRDLIDENTTEIELINQKLLAGEILLRGYESDAVYEAANSAPPYTDQTAIYYNTTTGTVRYYDGIEEEWAEVGTGGGIGAHEALGVGNGTNTQFNINTLPNSDDSFIVFLNGVYQDQSKYSFSNPTITFNVAPSLGQKVDVFMLTEGKPSLAPIQSNQFVVGYAQLTQTDVDNKFITLPSNPAVANRVVLDVVHGSAQIYGFDFVVSGSTLSWDGLGLELEVTEDTILRYFYFT